ncbi:DUF488 domain-containing protein [Thalassoroseus pseudoceratinae]|uniref:DUF488 domain-containing protein n=1 Tax=Thalassoroseus pseudoceratinae TaxID=2713176 RepID=UPI00197D1183|nr:DUF488 domain-containing protein [Thalassoroseus pseudoceratinae]
MIEKSIWTIGHSKHAIEHFLSIVRDASIECVVDVRRFAGSKRQPQFGQKNLQSSLQEIEVSYIHLPDLGGRRKKRADDSPNHGWRVESFNAYADYMLTESFQSALSKLEEIATDQATAIMCAEAVPWRCHRRLIADALIVRDWAVWDIFAQSRIKEHQLTDFAQVEDHRLTYPAI